MRRSASVLALCILAIVSTTGLARALDTSLAPQEGAQAPPTGFPIFEPPGEKIARFFVDMALGSDGELQVKETITYDFGDAERHGIYRNIPLAYDGGRAAITLADVAVTDADGISQPFTRSRSGGYERVRIGDPDALVSGVRTYVIRYRVRGGIRWGESEDRLIWNVTGNEWEVPIQDVAGVLVLPPGAPQTPGNFLCYAGYAGSTELCRVEFAPSVVRFFALRRPLGALEGITLSATFPKGVLTPPPWWEEWLARAGEYAPVLLPIGVLLFLLRRWWRHGRDPKGRGTIVPQYESPPGLAPIEAGILHKGRMTTEHVSAELISLAVRGYLKISPIGPDPRKAKDYAFEKLKDAGAEDPRIDQVLLTGLFSDPKSLNMAKLKAMFGKLSKASSESETMLAFQEFGPVGSVVTASSLQGRFQSTLQAVKRAAFESLTAKGYYERDPDKLFGRYVLAGMGCFIVAGLLFFSVSLVAAGSVAAAGIIMMVFGRLMARPTAKGVQEKEYILGFRDYLDIAEKDRLNFHNAPEKRPEIFEKFLPYALALGVAEAWGREFEGIYVEPPRWYGGGVPGAFAASTFASDLGHFSAVAGKTAFSASGGGSGGGGGFSGGGAGGGGGGSW